MKAKEIVTKEIVSYLSDDTYCILMPVYYECELKPAWRVEFIGSLEECKERFDDFPDNREATHDENLEMRKNRLQEYLFLKETGRRKEDCKAIKEMYGFN